MKKENPLNNDELRLFDRRDLIIKSALTVPFFGLIWRLWNLQVFDGKKFRDLSKGNRIRLKSVPASRGIIYDRAGIILAKNSPLFNLVLVREDCDDIPGTLKKISRSLKIPLKRLEDSLYKNRRLRKFQPILLVENLSWTQMAIVNAYQEQFPGVSIDKGSRRKYTFGTNGSNFLGYMGTVSEEQAAKMPKNRKMSAQIVGRQGLEKIYNESLIGIDGGLQVEVNSVGRIMETMNSIEPVPGRDIRLTINSKLQNFIEETLDQKVGAVVVMEPDTGNIQAMVSTPSYNPNEFSLGISRRRWKQMLNDPRKILSDKTIQGVYSPGSTFKMAVAACGLELGIIDENSTYNCRGVYRYSRRLRMHCWKRSGHGSLNVVEAIENSCNVFFYKLIQEIGVDRLNEFVKRFGLGSKTGINLLNEKSGVIPSKRWKYDRFKEIWYPGETLPVGIGQGYVTVTPLQLCNYISVIAKDGILARPRIVDKVLPNIYEKVDEHAGLAAQTGDPLIQNNMAFAPGVLKIIREGMIRNVNGRHGTGRRARSSIVTVAGKTGTTQVISNATKARLIKQLKEGEELNSRYYDHAWFAGFAPAANPKIAFSILLENGKSGSNAAAVMKKIIDFYFTNIEPIPAGTGSIPIID